LKKRKRTERKERKKKEKVGPDQLMERMVKMIMMRRMTGNVETNVVLARMNSSPIASQGDSLAKVFWCMDRDDDGFITLEEFVWFVQWAVGETRGKSVTAENIQQLFGSLDQDRDGKINLEEATEGLTRTDLPVTVRPSLSASAFTKHRKSEAEKAAEAFRLMDGDNDGLITLEEFERFIQIVKGVAGAELSSVEVQAKVRENFKSQDSDRDGKINLSEATDGLRRYSFWIEMSTARLNWKKN